jgi:hypothetical protein
MDDDQRQHAARAQEQPDEDRRPEGDPDDAQPVIVVVGTPEQDGNEDDLRQRATCLPQRRDDERQDHRLLHDAGRERCDQGVDHVAGVLMGGLA